ncbi:MAG: hypothetical protein LBS46_02375 [Dysgonamonadaceae bacterium]|jgi:hypothetical protein|nr:hypothetical protein [Dysgonamonadaceae bacterium]
MKTELSIRRYAGYAVSVVLLLSAVIFLLASCEKEWPDGKRSLGKLVAVNFSVKETPYNDGGSLRSASGTIAPETVVVPIEGNWCMYATLEPVPADATRASGDGFIANARLMIAAYEVSGGTTATTATASAQYQVNSDKSITPVADPLAVPIGDYKFVAYSYNKTNALPSFSETISNIDPSTNDLLWGASGTPSIRISGNDDNNVDILLQHLFSQVTVSATTNATSGYPSGVPPTINSVSVIIKPKHRVSVKVQNGTFTGTTVVSAGQTVTKNTTTSTATTWVSKDTTVYTGETNATNPITVTLTNLSLSGVNTSYFPVLTAKFAMALVPNGKYDLKIHFKQVEFAGSNIYWVTTTPATPGTPGDGYLTFDEAGNNANNMYQGLLFRWGSLVGIAGMLTPANDDGTGSLVDKLVRGTKDDPTTGTPIYVPKYTIDQGRQGYMQTNMASMSSNGGVDYWTTFTGIVANTAAPVTDIPYFDGSYATSVPSGRSTTFVSDAAQNTPAMWESFRGDICQYINNDYRLPVSYEFGSVSGKASYGTGGTTSIGWTRLPADNATAFPSNAAVGSADGKSGTPTIYGVTHYSGVSFPVAGTRSFGNDALWRYRNTGDYWSSSVHSTRTNAYELGITGIDVYPGQSNTRALPFPIRCVKK